MKEEKNTDIVKMDESGEMQEVIEDGFLRVTLRKPVSFEGKQYDLGFDAVIWPDLVGGTVPSLSLRDSRRFAVSRPDGVKTIIDERKLE